MERNMNSKVEIPAALSGRVEESLSQVTRLHRKRVMGRIGAACGSVAGAFALVVLVGTANPALAAQLPIIGKFFATDDKVYVPNVPDSASVVSEAAKSANENCDLQLVRSYSDGNTVQLGFTLNFTGDLADRYYWIDTQGGQNSTATVNGVQAEKLSLNNFSQVDGVWISTMNIELPESTAEDDTLDLHLNLAGFSGTLEEYDVTSDTFPEKENLDVSFELDCQVEVDRDGGYSFLCNAQDNGATVTAVSGTKSQTVISVTKPYWGEIFPETDPTEPDVHPMGFPHLYTADGTEIRQDARSSEDKGGYDYNARYQQSCDLYFDAIPEGETTVILRFVKGDMWDDVLAEFTIDLEAETVK